jgi:hypothetical protein
MLMPDFGTCPRSHRRFPFGITLYPPMATWLLRQCFRQHPHEQHKNCTPQKDTEQWDVGDSCSRAVGQFHEIVQPIQRVIFALAVPWGIEPLFSLEKATFTGFRTNGSADNLPRHGNDMGP